MPGSRQSPKKSSAERCNAAACAIALTAASVSATIVFSKAANAQSPLRQYSVVGDAIPEPLTGTAGDAARGRTIVANRAVGLCLLCHTGPFPDEKFQGTLAPDLRGAGSRWSEGQLRLRIVDPSKFNPDTIMPPYYRIEGLARVASNFAGKPVLTAEQIEDVVAYLARLRD